MRSLALMTALLMIPGTAFAGAVTVLPDQATGADSIMQIGTPAPEAPPAQQEPTLKPGHELIRVKKAKDGETKIYRTEAWLGGSPVTFVTTATPAELAALESRGIDVASSRQQPLQPAMLAASGNDTPKEVAGVDSKETTGALNRGSTPAPLDAARFKLRPLLGNG